MILPCAGAPQTYRAFKYILNCDVCTIVSSSSTTDLITMANSNPMAPGSSAISICDETPLCCSSDTEMNDILTGLVRAPRVSSVLYKRAPKGMSLSMLGRQDESRAHEANTNPCRCGKEDEEGKTWYIPTERECACESPCGKPCLLQAMHHSCASYNTALGSRISAGESQVAPTRGRSLPEH